MKISIIVPVYNVENVLHYCIDSILAQTFKDFELILVDDGSTDSSGVICDKYEQKDNRIRTHHKKNGGVSDARNYGMSKALGDYILFVDSDDFLESDYVEELVKLKDLYPEYENIWCGFQMVDGYYDFNIINVFIFETQSTTKSSVQYVMDLHKKWLVATPYCKLFCRNIIEENALFFNENLSLGEDLLFNLNYLDCTDGKIVVMNKALYNYFSGNNHSLNNRYRENLLSVYKEINNVFQEKIKKWKCDERQLQQYIDNVYFQYETVLFNTMRGSTSFFEKMKYNNSILRSYGFQDSYSSFSGKLNLIFKLSYSLKNFLPIAIMIKFKELKNDKR